MSSNKTFSIARFLIVLIIGTTLYGCSKQQRIPIPYVPVNHTVYLNNPSNDVLRVPGGHLVIPNQGNLGIILYRVSYGTDYDFVAYDLTCSHEPTGNCVVAMDETEFYVDCPCCGSKFQIFDGYPAEGPAKWPLLKYSTTSNDNVVRIYN